MFRCITDVESTTYRNSISLTNDELLIVIYNVTRLKNRVNILHFYIYIILTNNTYRKTQIHNYIDGIFEPFGFP